MQYLLRFETKEELKRLIRHAFDKEENEFIASKYIDIADELEFKDLAHEMRQDYVIH